VCVVATTTVAGVSCGGGASGGASATSRDGGGVDANVPDGAWEPSTLPVTVQVLEDGKPASNARVIFHDESGQVIGEAKTDDHGRVSRSPAPSMVTLQDRNGLQLLTFTDVVGGDTLTVTGNEVVPSGAPIDIGGYDVDVGSSFPQATDFVSFVGSCASSHAPSTGFTMRVRATDGCARTGDGVLVVATDGRGTTLAFAGKGGLTANRSATAFLAVNAGPLIAATATTFENRLKGGPDVAESEGELGARIGGEYFPLATFASQWPGSPVQAPAGMVDGFEVFFRLFLADTSRRSFSQVRAFQAAGPFVADSDEALPLVTDASVASVSPDRFDLAWTLAAPATTTDGTVVVVDMGGPEPMPVSGGWSFIVRPGLTSLRTPLLPADVFDRAGRPKGMRSVSILDSDDVGGFGELKQIPNVWSGNAPFAQPYPRRVGMRVRVVVRR
jgi:hypothetical protein